jgi:hypothetical protein
LPSQVFRRVLPPKVEGLGLRGSADGGRLVEGGVAHGRHDAGLTPGREVWVVRQQLLYRLLLLEYLPQQALTLLLHSSFSSVSRATSGFIRRGWGGGGVESAAL